MADQQTNERNLMRIEALCTDSEHVYECNACLWTVFARPDRTVDSIEFEFNEHLCTDYVRERADAAGAGAA
jgi:hypothetical protein